MARRASAEPQLALPPVGSSMASKALWNRLNLVPQDDQPGRRRAASMMGPPERGGYIPSPLAQEEPDHDRLVSLSIGEPDLFNPKMEDLAPSAATRARSGTVGAFAPSPGGYAPLATLPSSLRAHQPTVPSPFASFNESDQSHPSSSSSGPAPHIRDDQESRTSAIPLDFNAESQSHATSGQGVAPIHAPVYPWTAYPVPYTRPAAPAETASPFLPVPSSSDLAKQTTSPPAPMSVAPIPPAATAGKKAGIKAASGPPPSRALWIGSLPPNLTTSALTTLFRRWGPLESTRVLSIKNCAFVNFVHVDDAVSARQAIVGTRWDAWDCSVGLGLGLDAAGFDAGTIKSEFAKASPAPASNGSATGDRAVPATDPKGNPFSAVAREHNAAHGLFSASNSIVPSSDRGGVALPPEVAVTASLAEQRTILATLGPNPDGASPEQELPASLAVDPSRLKRFSSLLPSPPAASRRFDGARLRELRRAMDAPSSVWEVDRCAEALIPVLPALATDYLGNVLVQRLFEQASDAYKLTMLQALAPHLARIGCHKNGTWVAQKLLECIPRDSEMVPLAVDALTPYVPPLLLDQFGNYVVQGLLPLGPPHTDAIFAAFLEQTWEIAQGRFGARSMRALLDHPCVTARQRRLVGLAVVLCAVPLACSANGTMLLHWVLDDPFHVFPGQRHALLAARLRPYLSDLATHKLGSIVLLRLAHQTSEPDVARDMVQTLFEGSPPPYLDILLDPVHGSQVIAQALAAPCLDSATRARYIALTRTVVQDRELAHVPSHRMLAEAVGLLLPPGYH